jgi:hypothetical protein
MASVEAMHKNIKKRHVKFLEFTRIYSKKPSCLVCFFEGEDARYYGLRISCLTGMEWEGIDCSGKERVIELCRVLETHSEYRCAKTAFFVDRDFDPPLSPDKRTKIYETPCYSVENFYTSLACFEQILKHGFKIREFVEADKLIFRKCISLFTQTQKKFHDAIAPLNAWIMLMRKMARESSTPKKTSLNKIKFEQWVKIEVDNVTKQYTIDDINTTFPERDDIAEIEVTTKVNSFSTIDCGKTFRGKYEVEFLSKFLTKLKDDLCASSPKHFDEKRTIHFSLPPTPKKLKEPSDILSQFSQYADTPQCLRDYLISFSTS